MTISNYTIQNAGPRQIHRPNNEQVKDKLEEIGEKDGKSQEAELSQRAQRQAAKAVLDGIDLYA